MNKFVKIAIASGIALVVLGGVFLFLSADNGRVPRGSYVKGVDLSRMTKEEAVAAIGDAKINPAAMAVIDTGSGRINLAAGDVGAYYDAEKTVDNILNGKRNIIETIFGTKKVYNMAVELDDVKLDGAINEKMIGVEYGATDISYQISENGITVTNGSSGRKIDRAKAKEAVCYALENPGTEAQTLTPEVVAPNEVNPDEFLAQFGSEPGEASYFRQEDGSIAVTQESVGISIDKEAAKNVMNEHKAEGETYNLPAEVVMPAHTKAELEAALFRDVLATYSSSYASSGANRASNVALAASKVNGVILLPGETFSFNNTLGERTTANGYKSAHAYAAGQVVDQVGGGICQVSSTLYNSVLLANLKIDERRSHQMTVSYVPLGRDATVNWGTQDFKFSNNTAYPVKITASASGGKLETGVVGTQTDSTMTVKIETQTIKTLEPTVKTEEDPTLEEGKTKTVKTGSKGYVVDAYRVVYSGGTEVSREKLKRSTYNPTQTIKKVGTKKAAPPVQPETVPAA